MNHNKSDDRIDGEQRRVMGTDKITPKHVTLRPPIVTIALMTPSNVIQTQ